MEVANPGGGSLIRVGRAKERLSLMVDELFIRGGRGR